ncbi:MAG: diaminopimelate decarboxylase [Alphaproteobacteria bacterium]|jgi:diaminopimelate decarboxylase|nr:diaminopimelate decarboxylase [Alphaproteobacteria bacterium]MBT7942425.1 diaminopimelate decarboxylase [Alphaproteobacteria bacterium]
MDHFQYKNGEMYAEAVPVREIAERIGTPFYCYSTATLEHHYQVFADALSGMDATICFAVKANSNIAVLAALARLGAGADVVSSGEMKRALVAGVPPSKIVFSGVGKTSDEMAAALKAGVLHINVESLPELEMLSGVASSLDITANVAIRVNPDVDAKTHEKIATGKSENKFGVEWADVPGAYGRAAELPGIRATGVAVHIGSQILDLDPFRKAYGLVAELVGTLRSEGHAIDSLDLGGGLGIPYDGEQPPTPEAYGAMVQSVVGDLGCRVFFEPGRLIAGNAGILVTRVIRVKPGASRSFVIVDAAMNDMLRPTLYEAYHAIEPVREAPAGGAVAELEVVGPICETGDTFGAPRPMPVTEAGDLLAVRTAGAYGAVMASAYNTRPLVPEVLVKAEDFSVIRDRVTVDDMLSREQVPGWLTDGDGLRRKAGS